MKKTARLLFGQVRKRLFTKTFFGLLVILSFLFVFSYKSSASPAALPVYAGAYDNQVGLTPSIIDSLLAQIVGNLGSGGPQGGNSYKYEGGALYAVTDWTFQMYENPPASGIVWAQDQWNQIRGNASIVAQAQTNEAIYFPGLGYELLRPNLGLWQWARNLTYAFFIIILVAIAFLILFRQSLGGSTMVTIGNSLPSIILSLILVTLSYPISALFVDMVYIGSNFVQSVLITAPGSPGYDIVRKAQEGNPIKDKNGTGNNAITIDQLQPDDFQVSIWGIWGTASADPCQAGENEQAEENPCATLSILPNDNTIQGLWIGKVVEVILGQGNSLIRLLMAVATLGASFKLFLALMNNFIILTTYPMLSPVFFLTAAIPSRTGAVIQDFLKSLFAASLVFIVIYFFFLLMVVIGNADQLESAFGQTGYITWSPPLLGLQNNPGSTATASSASIARIITTFGLFLFLPSIPDMIKNGLGVATGNMLLSTVYQRATGSLGFASNVGKRALSAFPAFKSE